MAECSDQNNQLFSSSNPVLPNSGSITVNLDEKNTIFNPNYALSALQTFNTFNNVANKMFGIEARWFRAIPQQRSKDIIFLEYTLSSVEDTPLCLKVIVPNGNFPDSKYQYDLMGLEYEIPLEIQIDKKYWEEISGFGTAPQRKDIVYLPMPNKLYQVESSYLKRGFMEQETTWVINLKKYSPESSRKEGDNLKQTIEQYTVSEQDLFGDLQTAEYDKLTDKKQMSQFNSTSRDQYKTLDDNLKLISANSEIHGIIFSQGYYDMNTSLTFNAIEYKNPTGDDIQETYDRAITEWVNIKPIDKEYDVVWIQEDDTITQPANYKIKIKGTTKFKIDDTFVIKRFGLLNFYAIIIDDSHSSEGIYWCQIDDDVLTHLNSINQNWSSLKSYKMKIKDPVILLNGINETNGGFKTSIYANQYIKVNYGSQQHITILNEELKDNKWYGFVINIGNTWNQYNIYVWEESTNPTTKLQIKYYETLKFVPQHITIDKYVVNKSLSYITNIRLFKTTIEEEKQTKELLSYFTQNSDQSLILDNCDVKFIAPYISAQK